MAGMSGTARAEVVASTAEGPRVGHALAPGVVRLRKALGWLVWIGLIAGGFGSSQSATAVPYAAAPLGLVAMIVVAGLIGHRPPPESARWLVVASACAAAAAGATTLAWRSVDRPDLVVLVPWFEFAGLGAYAGAMAQWCRASALPTVARRFRSAAVACTAFVALAAGATAALVVLVAPSPAVARVDGDSTLHRLLGRTIPRVPGATVAAIGAALMLAGLLLLSYASAPLDGRWQWRDERAEARRSRRAAAARFEASHPS